MSRNNPAPMEITPAIAAKCVGRGQFARFDRLVRSMLTTASIKSSRPSAAGSGKTPAKKKRKRRSPSR